MTIHVQLPTVEPTPTTRPAHCPHCGHWHLQRHGTLRKPLRDLQVHSVVVARYRCRGCGHTFRHYPAGVTAAAHSQRLVALLALLWALGLSLRRTALVLGLLGLPTSYLSVWRAVQTVGQRLRRLPARPVQVLGVDGTGMRLAGTTTGVVVAVDLGSGQVLDLLLGEERDPAVVAQWLAPLVAAHGGAVLVGDDLASHRVVATRLGCQQQVCQFHLQRWVGRALRQLETELGAPWQPTLATVRTIVRDLAPAGGAQLFALWQTLRAVPHPRAGPRGPESRLWALLIRLSEHWAHYRLYAERADVPATNNRTEQAVGRLKVRSRTVRGYKSAAGLLNGCALAARVGTGRPLDLAFLGVQP